MEKACFNCSKYISCIHKPNEYCLQNNLKKWTLKGYICSEIECPYYTFHCEKENNECPYLTQIHTLNEFKEKIFTKYAHLHKYKSLEGINKEFFTDITNHPKSTALYTFEKNIPIYELIFSIDNDQEDLPQKTDKHKKNREYFGVLNFFTGKLEYVWGSYFQVEMCSSDCFKSFVKLKIGLIVRLKIIKQKIIE